MDLLAWRSATRRLAARPSRLVFLVALLAGPIGLTLAAARLTDGILLRPLDFPAADRLVVPSLISSNGDTIGFAGPDAQSFRAESRSFAALAEYDAQTQIVQAGSFTDRVDGAEVSAGLAATVGVAPTAGRFFGAEEDRPGGPNVVVISASLAARAFGSVSNSVGATIRLAGDPYHVVGVMPPAFRFPVSAQYWIPVWRDRSLERRDNFDLTLVGRLRNDADLTAARAEIALFAARQRTAFADRAGLSASVTSLAESLLPEVVRRTALGVQVAVGALWCLSLVVLTALIAADGAARGKEVAIRAAIGASDSRQIGDFLIDAAALALVAGAAGWALGGILIGVARTTLPTAIAAWLGRSAGTGEVVAGIVVVLVSTIVLGMAPGWWLVRRVGAGPASLIGGIVIAPKRDRLLPDWTVAIAGGLATALLLLGGTLIDGLRRLHQTPLGFDPEGVAVASYSVQGDRFNTRVARQGLALGAVAAAAATPGVSQAAGATRVPGLGTPMPIGVRATLDSTVAHFVAMTPGYFGTLRIGLVAGRDFELSDLTSDSTRRVAIVSGSLARRLWPSADPVGQWIETGAPGQPTPVGSSPPRHRIVGVVADVNDTGFEGKPAGTLYVPISTFPAFYLHVIGRGADPAALARQLGQLGADVPVFRSTLLSRELEQAIWRPRATTYGLSALAVIGSLMALAGVAAAVRFRGMRREREIAVRLAIGAGDRSIVWLLVRTPVLLLVGGAIMGAILTPPIRAALRPVLGHPAEPSWAVVVAVVASMVATGVLAASVPAIRLVRRGAAPILRSGS